MKQPESILLAFAHVVNNDLKHLNPELQKIRNVLKDAEEANLLNIIEHNGVTYNSLSFLLHSAKGKNITMLHFSGHSSRNGLMVQSHDETGVVAKKSLTNLIRAHRKFRFVFLNSCYSKEIAQELIDAGVPYVIGTSNKINDEVAAIVAARFYSLLAKSHKSVEEAFLLTKDYIDDPMNYDDADQKEAFRTFELFSETSGEYPWQLYQRAELKDKDRNWMLVPAKKSPKLYIVVASAILFLLLVVFINNKLKTNETAALRTADSSEATGSPPVDKKVADSTIVKREQNSNTVKTPVTSRVDSPKKQDTGSKRLPHEDKVVPSESASLKSLHGARFEQLSSTDRLSFHTVREKNTLSFSGKLAGYLVSGRLRLVEGRNFQVSEGNIRGSISFLNNDENVSGHITVRESELIHTIDLERMND